MIEDMLSAVAALVTSNPEVRSQTHKYMSDNATKYNYSCHHSVFYAPCTPCEPLRPPGE